MSKKSKKAASAVALSVILAAQSLMSVSAAGGSITADMSTKSPVIRVEVPTKMAVSVNEFEMGDTGSQITSGVFTMKNMSEIPVKVNVSSEATVGANTVLVATKKAAQDSTDAAKPAMWLAAVAAIKDNSGTLEYTTATDKTVGGLAGTEDNSTAFGTKDASNKSKAVQNFYLQAATGATYEGIFGGEVAAAGIGGADFYELEEITTVNNAATAATAAATQDIYIGTAPAANTPSTLTKVEKGTAESSITWSGSPKAYKLKDAPTKEADLAASTPYLYIKNATAPASGGAAAFRYAGALSGAKLGWSTTDLVSITITYDIVGISSTAYTDVAKADGSGLAYGFKADDTLTLAGSVLTAKIKVTDFQSGTLKLGDVVGALDETAGEWGGADDAVTFTLNDTWMNALKGKTFEVSVILKSGNTITKTFTVPAE